MFKMKALIAATLLLAAPAAAQQAAPAGASEAAKRMVQENFKQRDAALAPLVAKRRALQKQFDALLTPEGYDEKKLAANMAEIRKVEGQIVETTGVSMLALLKTLPDNDRTVFFRSLKRPGAPARPIPQGNTGR
jgi:uncharacterized membrane protein